MDWNLISLHHSATNGGNESDSSQEEEELRRPTEAEIAAALDEMANGVVHLQCESSAEGGVCHVYLVGTAHVSQDSCREVKDVISYLKPQLVFLELCTSRINILTPQNLEVPTMSEMFEMWKTKKANPFGILYSWFLAKVASEMEVFPGAEFRVAYEEARNVGSRVILGDRPVHITLRRTWGKMPLWHKIKFLYHILFQTFFLPSPEEINKMLKELNDVDALTIVVQEMSKSFPSLIQTLILERDLYMSHALYRVAKEHSSIVAVVGRGHLNGIKENWTRPVEMNSLLEVPMNNKGFSAIKILASVGVLTGVCVASGIYMWVRK
ncbi:hypothetical protein LUZ60_005535 [Juncus effusus]|nr:hypothetical protein LUZ60_005535 [Juncus effusus]